MSTVEKIPTAVEKISQEEPFSLFGWLEETASLRATKLRRLRAAIDVGLAEADRDALIAAEEAFARLKARVHRLA